MHPLLHMDNCQLVFRWCMNEFLSFASILPYKIVNIVHSHSTENNHQHFHKFQFLHQDQADKCEILNDFSFHRSKIESKVTILTNANMLHYCLVQRCKIQIVLQQQYEDKYPLGL